MENAKKLMKVVQNKINTNEYNCCTIKGIRNISRSDLEEIKLYLEQYMKTNGESFGVFMSPCGNVKEVLDKHGIKVSREQFVF